MEAVFGIHCHPILVYLFYVTFVTAAAENCTLMAQIEIGYDAVVWIKMKDHEFSQPSPKLLIFLIYFISNILRHLVSRNCL